MIGHDPLNVNRYRPNVNVRNMFTPLRNLGVAASAIYNRLPSRNQIANAYNTVNNAYSRYVYKPARNYLYSAYLYDRLYGQPASQRPRSHFGATRRQMFKRKRKYIKRRKNYRKF